MIIKTPVEHAESILIAEPRLEDIKTRHGLMRLHYIDGMRAFAALWVVFFHGWQPGNPAAQIPVLGFIFRIFTLGQPPVLIFLVLSGFCLYYPLVLKNPEQPTLKITYMAFILRRARRILPPFYAALAISLLAIVSIPLMAHAASNDPWIDALPVNFHTVVAHLLMVHNLSSLDWKKINYPAWTIGLEWQLYLFFPLFVWLFRTRKAAVTLSLALIVTFIVRLLSKKLHGPLGFALDWGPLNYSLVFVSGMYAAQCTVRGISPSIPRWGLGLVCLMAFSIVFYRGLHGAGLETGAFVLIPLGTFCLLLLAAEPLSLIQKIFSTHWLVKVGVFSYSIYLLHAPVLHFFVALLAPVPLAPFWRYLVICIVIVPIIVGIAYLFFLVFERPFIGASRKKPALDAPV